jgi:hypothetical protein
MRQSVTMISACQDDCHRHLRALRLYLQRTREFSMTTLSPEIERLVKLVGAHTGKTAEEVLLEAVEALARIAGVDDPERRRPSFAIDLERVRGITRRVAALPLIDARVPRDICDEAWSRK